MLTARKISLEVNCSPSFSDDFTSGPMSVDASETTIRLYFAESNTFAALFEQPVLIKLLRYSGVTLEAILPSPDVKSKKRGKTAAETLMFPPVVAQIVVYGNRANMYEVGDALSDAGLYLQHPSVETDATVEYFNPQYLLRPGETFPQPVAMADSSRRDDPFEEISRAHAMNQLNQVFDGANGPAAGEYKVVGQSERLRTTLRE